MILDNLSPSCLFIPLLKKRLKESRVLLGLEDHLCDHPCGDPELLSNLSMLLMFNEDPKGDVDAL